MDVVLSILESNTSDTTMLCDISVLFDDIKILDRSSSSQSMQVLASIKDVKNQWNENRPAHKILSDYFDKTGTRNVFIKIGFNSPEDNSATVERAMYKYLKNLILTMRTPNIMRYIMSFECNNFANGLQYLVSNPYLTPEAKAMAKNMLKMVTVLYSENYTLDMNNATIMVLERGLNCGALYQCMQSGGLDIKDVQAILFQIFYTLREMFTAGVRHNDLHLNNIWINTMPAPVRLIYFTDDDHYAVIETKHIVKIYDFDRSAFTDGAIVNNILDEELCTRVGECSNPNERFDIHTVMHGLLLHFGIPTATKKFSNPSTLKERITNVAFDIIKNPVLRTPACCVHPGTICNKIPHPTIKGSTICDQKYQVPASDMMNFKDMIASPKIFGGMMRNISAGFRKEDLPMKKLFTLEEIKTYIPKNVFETNFFVSQDCSLSPLETANKIYTTVEFWAQDEI